MKEMMKWHFQNILKSLVNVLFFVVIIFVIATLFCFTDVKEIVQIFQAPAVGVKFLQFAPGEYFFASFKIAIFCGFLVSSPLALYQLLLYLIPGLTKI